MSRSHRPRVSDINVPLVACFLLQSLIVLPILAIADAVAQKDSEEVARESSEDLPAEVVEEAPEDSEPKHGHPDSKWGPGRLFPLFGRRALACDGWAAPVPAPRSDPGSLWGLPETPHVRAYAKESP